jgi:hypothetical protein
MVSVWKAAGGGSGLGDSPFSTVSVLNGAGGSGVGAGGGSCGEASGVGWGESSVLIYTPTC